MMTMEEIIFAEATLSENNSLLAYHAICTEQRDWRVYSPMFSHYGIEEVNTLISRYLTSHAMMPSLITKEVLAGHPIEIFSATIGDAFRIHGGLFANGAVVNVKPAQQETYNILFIDDSVATRWGYPEGYTFLNRPD